MRKRDVDNKLRAAKRRYYAAMTEAMRILMEARAELQSAGDLLVLEISKVDARLEMATSQANLESTIRPIKEINSQKVEMEHPTQGKKYPWEEKWEE